MNKYLFVVAGGALGSVARYWVGTQAMRLFGTAWPYGTFAVNVIGGCLMGALATTLALRGDAQQEAWRVLLGVGCLGGFTTFSAFTLEAALMIERRAYGQALTYTTASVLVSLAAFFAGMLIARRMFAL